MVYEPKQLLPLHILLLTLGEDGGRQALSAVKISPEILGSALGTASEWGQRGINAHRRLFRESATATLAVLGERGALTIPGDTHSHP